MLRQYLDGSCDLQNSFVIGDRASDIQLAKNLGAGAIFIGDQGEGAALSTTDWDRIYTFLLGVDRQYRVERKTNETDIVIELNLKGTGQAKNQTGIAFFDHMLEQLAKHGQLDLTVKVKGDLEVDEHHTIEDTALALGEAFHKALGSKRGIERYGYCLPMDDCLAQVAIDFGGRNWLEWEVEFKRERIGRMPTEMFFHFFKSFTDTAKCNLNIKAEGDNEHHKIEAIFKAFAKSIKMAVKQDPESDTLPSTKGVL
jgi:imidazoleglycerol-phosphate dehydratase/histidinol-phosphatase